MEPKQVLQALADYHVIRGLIHDRLLTVHSHLRAVRNDYQGWLSTAEIGSLDSMISDVMSFMGDATMRSIDVIKTLSDLGINAFDTLDDVEASR